MPLGRKEKHKCVEQGYNYNHGQHPKPFKLNLMKIVYSFFVLALALLPITMRGQANSGSKSCIPCEKLQELQLPDVTILKIESLSSDTIKSPVPWIPAVFVKVPFCRILARIGKEIHFELLVPQNWNGRFVMSGGGGFVGRIQNDLIEYVNQGFATAGTDTGHQGSDLDADWALNNMERQLNFGHLAVHRTAVVCKSVLRNLYCADPLYSYFLGCSRGGGQAMMEAQAYPDDFDGIVAGAPAFNWPAIGAKFIEGCKSNFPSRNNNALITNNHLKLLQDYVLRQCDKLDGVNDRIINDPRECKIDFEKLPLCPADKAGPTCFTQEQITAIKSIYSPTVLNGEVVYPAFPVGLEAEDGSWAPWIVGGENFASLHCIFGTNMFKYLVFNDSTWDYRKYDFKDFSEETRYASSYLDATQTDYTEFKRSKGKMIMYHGWNDPALSAYATIQHYEEAMRKDKDLQSHIRLFLLPGVLHCGGGTGPDAIDWVKLIQDWVENEKAPERIVLAKIEKGKMIMTRPVFPYPNITVYNGKGDPNSEASFKVKPVKWN